MDECLVNIDIDFMIKLCDLIGRLLGWFFFKNEGDNLINWLINIDVR